VLATWIAPYPYAAFDIAHRLSPPSSIHLMGTDQFGRDTLSRVIYGARISLTVAIAATFIGTLVGIAVGAVAGFVSGWIDEVAMRSMDVILAFPPIVLALAMAALLEPSLQKRHPDHRVPDHPAVRAGDPGLRPCGHEPGVRHRVAGGGSA
jgi:peptide/nickel transport system permease protein